MERIIRTDVYHDHEELVLRIESTTTEAGEDVSVADYHRLSARQAKETGHLLAVTAGKVLGEEPTKYARSTSESSFCPACDGCLTMVASNLMATGEPAFYVCWGCSWISQIGVGPVLEFDEGEAEAEMAAKEEEGDAQEEA